MIQTDEDALICDLAETYGIFDYRQLPADQVAVFAFGLRDDSRIKLAMTNSNSPESENIKAWGGVVVSSVQKEKTDTFKYMLIEALNVDVLKEVYGSDNVSGDLSSGIAIKANSKELPHHCLVIETVLKGGVLKRIVIHSGKVTAIDEITYNDGSVLGYGTTVTAFPNAADDTHYEYIKGA